MAEYEKKVRNNARNYQKELDKILERIRPDGEGAFGGARNPAVPRLLLHSCCAPCSSYVLEYLRQYFFITVFYYNPNISFEQEYQKRVEEQKRLIAAYNAQKENGYPIAVIEGDYEPSAFYGIAKGLEHCPEGGERCFACYRLRLQKTAALAETLNRQASAAERYDYFTTTLTISPLKNAAKLNEIGEQLAQERQIAWLPSDFKKKNGYQRSIALSAEYGLYRQNYCGCVYSIRQ